jgi:thiamine-phosphate pyrophosphorylase
MRTFPGLCVLLDDDERWALDPVEQARAALRGGARWLQLRAKRATDSQALVWAETIAPLARRASALFFVNDRFDLALAAGADGVHLGQEDVPPDRIPSALRERLCVGRSTHTLQQARTARFEPIDYVAFGPVFGTRSKQSGYAARGTAMLAQVADLVRPLPLVAIGGIGPANCSEVLRAGADCVAVISAILGATCPARAARELIENLGPKRGGASG